MYNSCIMFELSCLQARRESYNPPRVKNTSAGWRLLLQAKKVNIDWNICNHIFLIPYYIWFQSTLNPPNNKWRPRQIPAQVSRTRSCFKLHTGGSHINIYVHLFNVLALASQVINNHTYTSHPMPTCLTHSLSLTTNKKTVLV